MRPANLRWLMWDAGNYPKLAEAYAEGLAGTPLRWPGDSIFAVAWLAGLDLVREDLPAAAAAREAAAP
jgi:hypothetical protein